MFNLFKKMRGDELLRVESEKSNLDISTVLKEVRNQGATDEDIREWWNMPDPQHQEIMKEDDTYRDNAYRQWLKEGLSKKDALLKLQKGFPLYEIYKPGVLHSSDDNLPYELSPRINRFFKSPDNLTKYKKEIEKATSMNAFIRSLLKQNKF